MDDKTLLELAAKAAGVRPIDLYNLYDRPGDGDGIDRKEWNPLTDDGDALRLAIALKDISIVINSDIGITDCKHANGHWVSGGETHWNNDAGAATRRAIVRAAAEIGKQIGEGS